MTELFNPVGPEANNRRAHIFEDHIASWMQALGWSPICRNIDMYSRTGGQGRGVDILGAFNDPQLGHRFGLIAEAKVRHVFRGDQVQKDVAILSQKVAQLSPQIGRLDIGEDIHATQLGVLVYDAKPFDAAKLAEALGTLHPQGLVRSEWPRTVHVLGPDTLIGMADAFNRAEPAKFYWPPFDRTQGTWAQGAPPHQVVQGVLAWKTKRGKVVLWLRDPLPHDEDFPWVCAITHDWQINVDQIICSSVSRDHWSTQRTRWASEFKKAEHREYGRVPDDIDPRDLSWGSLTPFTDRWGQEDA